MFFEHQTEDRVGFDCEDILKVNFWGLGGGGGGHQTDRVRFHCEATLEVKFTVGGWGWGRVVHQI